MKAALCGRHELRFRVLLDIVEVEGCLKEFLDIVQGWHVLVGFGGVPNFDVVEGIALQEAIGFAPFGKHRGAEGVVVKRCGSAAEWVR